VFGLGPATRIYVALGATDMRKGRVKNVRNYYQIPVYVREDDRSWVTMEEAAGILNTGVTVIRTMIRKQFLPARQAAKHAPWTIRREDL
jgi:hypothetical protein